MGHFKVKAKNNLGQMNIGDILSESDFAQLMPNGDFVQLEYVEEDTKKEKYQVKPGIWTIKHNFQGLKLESTAFVKDTILDSFVSTKDITDRIDCFFSRFQVYYDFGIEVPKRGILLYGPPGTGKSTSISQVAEKYSRDNKTAIIIWPTDKYEAWKVKDFIKTFEYVEGVEKLILIVEDIGGVEIDQVRMKSDSSLLALLDNQEKTFTIPVLILATTNFPEVFLGNLTNRPQRFDDKIEVGYPESKYRQELLKFFFKKEVPQEVLDLMADKKTEKFSAAHIREVVIRSAIYDKSLEYVINEMSKEIAHYEKAFTKRRGSMGIMGDDD